ncbi:zinc-binding dehydrogenase, partial [Streptomyces hydrogenans]
VGGGGRRRPHHLGVQARQGEAGVRVVLHFDLVVETAGAPGTAASSCLLARRGGRVVLTGMFAEGATGIDPVHLSVSQLELRSVFGASSAAWADAVRAFATGLLDPAPLVTHEFPLERFAEALALVGGDDPTVGKVLLRP